MSDLCLNCGLCCTTLFFSAVPVHDDEVAEVPAHLKLERRSDKLTVFALPCVAHQNYRCTVYDQRPKVCRSYRCDLLIDEEAGLVAPARARQVVAHTKKRFEAVEDQLASLAPRATYLLPRVGKVLENALSDPTAAAQLPDQFVQDVYEIQQLMQGFFKRREFLPAFKAANPPPAASSNAARSFPGDSS